MVLKLHILLVYQINAETLLVATRNSVFFVLCTARCMNLIFHISEDGSEIELV